MACRALDEITNFTAMQYDTERFPAKTMTLLKSESIQYDIVSNVNVFDAIKQCRKKGLPDH